MRSSQDADPSKSGWFTNKTDILLGGSTSFPASRLALILENIMNT